MLFTGLGIEKSFTQGLECMDQGCTSWSINNLVLHPQSAPHAYMKLIGNFGLDPTAKGASHKSMRVAFRISGLSGSCGCIDLMYSWRCAFSTISMSWICHNLISRKQLEISIESQNKTNNNNNNNSSSSNVGYLKLKCQQQLINVSYLHLKGCKIVENKTSDVFKRISFLIAFYTWKAKEIELNHLSLFFLLRGIT